MTFPKEPRAKLNSTNPIERLNGEIKRRTEVVGIPYKLLSLLLIFPSVVLDRWRVGEFLCAAMSDL